MTPRRAWACEAGVRLSNTLKASTPTVERHEVRSQRRLRWTVFPVAAAATLLLAGCSQEQQLGWLPTEPGLTNHVDGVIGLWVNSWIVLLVVGLITWGLTLWAIIAYRKRRGQEGLPVQLRYNMPIEIFYTFVPLILVIGFFAATVREQVSIEAPVADPDVKIQVMAKQWAWDINYVDEDVYFAGEQARHPKGEQVDTSNLPVLYLPVGKSVEIELRTRDVIHSFWVIDFLYKKDTIPFHSNKMYVTPQVEGTYNGKCAELCGQYHSLMLFQVKVVSQAEYERQIEALRNRGWVGQLDESYDRLQNRPGAVAQASTEH